MAVPVFRAPMRSRVVEVPAGRGAAHGLERDVVAIGEALPSLPASLDEAVAAAVRAYGDKAGRLVRAFATAPAHAFVWTRDGDGACHLGRIAGPWRYDDSAAARHVGLHHVRPATWIDRPFHDDEAPGGVVAAFVRGGRNFQRVRDPGAERATAALWERWCGVSEPSGDTPQRH